MRKEEEKRANPFSAGIALSKMETHCESAVNSMETHCESTCTSIGDELVFGNELLDCSHQISHMHDRHNKDEFFSDEQYCGIIAKMKIPHDPNM